MELSTLLKKDTLTVAKQLLGWELCYQSDKGPVGGIIAETEAYTEDDPACHAKETIFRNATDVSM